MIKQLSKNVHEVRIVELKVKDIDLWTLHCSDIHIDNPKCDRALLFKHFDFIKERKGKILIFGDLFDLMQGRYDPRKSYHDLRPEYKQDNYLDSVIDDTFKLLEPYVDNLLFLSYGNHCTAIVKNNNTDPLQRLYQSFKMKYPDCDLGLGAYQGFLIWRFGYGAEKNKNNQARVSSVTAYHHGSGGNTKRSKGMLENQIDGFNYPDADLIVKGHNHHKYFDPSNTRVKLSHEGNISYDAQKVLRLGTYESSANAFGWSVEKGFLPPGMGGWYVNYKIVNNKIEVQVIEAQ